MRRLVSTGSMIVMALSGCGAPQNKPDAPAGKPGVTLVAKHEIVKEEIEFFVGERLVRGTVTRPKMAGRHPAVLLHADAGPTDRDWNTTLAPGENGSGKLLAEWLSRHGAVVLRFDKQGSGKTTLPDPMSWDAFLADARGALTFLRAAVYVDPDTIFLAGHGEGAVHSMRIAATSKKPIAGLMLLGMAASTRKDLLIAQLKWEFEKRMRLSGDTLEAELGPIEAGLQAFIDGQEVDAATLSKHVPVQNRLARVLHPKAAPFTRELYRFKPVEAISEIRIPILILAGAKDTEIAADRDARLLEEAAGLGSSDVVVHISPTADHALKSESMPLAQIGPDAQLRYNAADRKLDTDAAGAITKWLAGRAGSAIYK